MTTYRLIDGGSHTRFEDGKTKRYRRGDEIELTDEEAASETFKGRIEAVAVPEPEPKPEPAKAPPTKRAAKRPRRRRAKKG